MYSIGREAARLAPWSARQRLTALKRIIPLKKVKAALRRAGRGRTFCPRTCDGFMLWFVVALGLFGTDCYRQLYRWLVPWTKFSTFSSRYHCAWQHSRERSSRTPSNCGVCRAPFVVSTCRLPPWKSACQRPCTYAAS